MNTVQLGLAVTLKLHLHHWAAGFLFYSENVTQWTYEADAAGNAARNIIKSSALTILWLIVGAK